MEEEKLLNCLKRRHSGRDKAVKSPMLESRFDVSGRTLREAINNLRCQGYPICSNQYGYYYALNEAEVTATIKQLNNRIVNIAKARNGLVHAAKQYTDDGQLCLPL